jgi:hypothetical protein
MMDINGMTWLEPLIANQRAASRIAAGSAPGARPAGAGRGSIAEATPPLARAPAPPNAPDARLSSRLAVIFRPFQKIAKKIRFSLRGQGRGQGPVRGGEGSAAGRRARGAVAGLLLSGPALAHGWYPLECCSDRDCFAVATAAVARVPGGWQLEDGTFIAWRDARPSPDAQFHVCRRQDGKGALIRMPGKPACFWAPMGGA